MPDDGCDSGCLSFSFFSWKESNDGRGPDAVR